VSASDERQIENLLYRYCELIDGGDYEGLGDLFARATQTSGAGVTVEGADETHAYFVKRTKRFPDTGTPKTKHLTTNVIIEVDAAAGKATSRSYFTVFQAVTGSLVLQPIIAGRYEDRFERDDDGWYFVDRRKTVDLEGDLSQHLLWSPSPNA
jgi:hypothetical protein